MQRFPLLILDLPCRSATNEDETLYAGRRPAAQAPFLHSLSQFLHGQESRTGSSTWEKLGKLSAESAPGLPFNSA